MTEEAVGNCTDRVDELSPAKLPVNIAPIKAEFLIVDAVETEASAERDEGTQKKTRRDRGMNKTRRRDMARTDAKIRQKEVQLCKNINLGLNEECPYGAKCWGEHDLDVFLSKKRKDLGDKCVNFDQLGKCPYAYECRFGGAHMDEEKRQIVKDAHPLHVDNLNARTMQMIVGMRKHTIDLSRSQQAMTALKEGTLLGSMGDEKRRLDTKSLAGKKYLAPLTTVGNLPFRRLCVEMGAEVTCGEMAVATSLLSGTKAEWSLMRRHPSERVFGVQLAGGFPDTMSKAAEMIVDHLQVDFIDVNLGCPIDVVNQKGGGCALASRTTKLIDVLAAMRSVMKDVPLTIKVRTGLKENELTIDKTLASLVKRVPIDLIDFHPRSKEQRYSKLARWDFVDKVKEAVGEVRGQLLWEDGRQMQVPLWACGDVLSYEDYYRRLETSPVQGVVIGRGALIKPWIFTEIDEKRHWDISSSQRLQLLDKFISYGLEHWGSDSSGVEKTRRFLLELLSFQCRYIPVGLLETLPQRINDRPPLFRGRDEMETLLSSHRSSDWVKISEIFLGPPPEDFVFIPKHKASAY